MHREVEKYQEEQNRIKKIKDDVILRERRIRLQQIEDKKSRIQQEREDRIGIVVWLEY